MELLSLGRCRKLASIQITKAVILIFQYPKQICRTHAKLRLSGSCEIVIVRFTSAVKKFVTISYSELNSTEKILLRRPGGKLDNHSFRWFWYLGPCEIAVVVFRVCKPLSEASCEIVIVRLMRNRGCPVLLLAGLGSPFKGPREIAVVRGPVSGTMELRSVGRRRERCEIVVVRGPLSEVFFAF